MWIFVLQGHILSTPRDALRPKTNSCLVYGRYEPGIEAGVLIPILYTQVAPYILVQQYFKPNNNSFQIRKLFAYNGNTPGGHSIHKKCESKGKLQHHSLGIQWLLPYQQTPLPLVNLLVINSCCFLVSGMDQDGFSYSTQLWQFWIKKTWK
jgi:hypothetical protein